ncbi:MAG: septum formation initiator family protein [Candidatus Spechtbacterales bacterium]
MKRLLASPFTALLLLVLGTLLLFGVVRQVMRAGEVGKEISVLEERLAAVQEQNEETQADLESLGDDTRIEKEARERLNLKKEGEHVVIILPAEEAEQSAAAENEETAAPVAAEEESSNKGLLQTVFGWLGGVL